jgi:hypothetical protein
MADKFIDKENKNYRYEFFHEINLQKVIRLSRKDLNAGIERLSDYH